MLFVLIPIIVIAYFWFKAKPKHRKEKLKMIAFSNEKQIPIGINIPRALCPIFAIFQGVPHGISFPGVHIFVYNELGQIAVGQRTGTRMRSWLFDLGVAGMVTADQTIQEAALAELHEEMGIESALEYLMPMRGYPCITFLYRVVISSSTKLQSKDGTFGSIEWVYPDKLNEYLECQYSEYKLYSDGASVMIKEKLAQKYSLV